MAGQWKKGAISLKWDGKAAERIVEAFERMLLNEKRNRKNLQVAPILHREPCGECGQLRRTIPIEIILSTNKNISLLWEGRDIGQRHLARHSGYKSDSLLGLETKKYSKRSSTGHI
jgi:hypothetical protein